MEHKINLFRLFSWFESDLAKASKLSINHYNSKGYNISICKDLQLSQLLRNPTSNQNIKKYNQSIIQNKYFNIIDCPPDPKAEMYYRALNKNKKLSKCELEKSVHKINSAMYILKKYDESIYNFVLSQVGYIQMWSSGTRATSSNTGDFDSRIMLWDIHHDHVSIFKIIEMILHESIHCFLNIYEMYQYFTTNKFNIEDVVFSKWSKNKIEPYSIIHACFVWFGLYQYAEKAKNYVEIDKNEIDKLQLIAKRGFILPGDLLDCIKVSHSTVSPHAIREIQCIQGWFRKKYLLSLERMNGSTLLDFYKREYPDQSRAHHV